MIVHIELELTSSGGVAVAIEGCRVVELKTVDEVSAWVRDRICYAMSLAENLRRLADLQTKDGEQ